VKDTRHSNQLLKDIYDLSKDYYMRKLHRMKCFTCWPSCMIRRRRGGRRITIRAVVVVVVMMMTMKEKAWRSKRQRRRGRRTQTWLLTFRHRASSV